MTERNINKLETPPEHNNLSDAAKHLQQQALTLFQCKDGSLVNNPRSCNQTLGALPSLEITGTQLAGKTFRRSEDGWTSDGGKILQS